MATSTNSHLEIDAVTKNFGPQAVLKGVNLSVARGGTTAIVGPSGSGKTTLLRLIAGFEHPDTGSISLNGSKVAGENAWVPAHKRHVGYVAQDGALFPHLTVGQNISFGLDAAQLPGGHRGVKARVGELLEMVSLDPAMAKRRPHQLSGGQQQRVALARALARKPALMLLTSRSPPWTPACGWPPGVPWPRSSRTPASPPSWSRMTKPRRCPSPTRWP